MDVSPRLALFLALLATLVIGGCDKKPGESKVTGASVGAAVDDGVITAKVKSALVADPNVKSFDVKVETHQGIVQLSGFVDSQTLVEHAVEVARHVEGVKNVENKMTVKSGGPESAGSLLDDSVITSKIKSSYLANSDMRGSDVSVVTVKGEVQLSGFASAAQIDRAIQIARRVDGVKSVINKISIKK